SDRHGGRSLQGNGLRGGPRSQTRRGEVEAGCLRRRRCPSMFTRVVAHPSGEFAMSHRRAGPAVLVVLFLLPVIARADDDEPVSFGKKLSVWVKTLQSSKDAADRFKAVLALERVGVTNKKVVPALVKAVRDDKNDRVRSSAARAVGRLVAKIIANA